MEWTLRLDGRQLWTWRRRRRRKIWLGRVFQLWQQRQQRQRRQLVRTTTTGPLSLSLSLSFTHSVIRPYYVLTHGRNSGKGSGSGSGKGSSSSSSGGRTSTGSGTKPSYGGGTYYSGGSSVPYRSGKTSPSGIVPVALGVGAGVAAGSALHFWPGLWYHPIYYYPYGHAYAYHNQSSNRNETKDVACGCDETVECGCDDNTNSTYFSDLLGNGSYAALNASGVSIADVNGTSTLLVNGSLPNGTTAAAGTDSASAAAGSLHLLLEHVGLAPAVAAMLVMVFV